MVYTLRFFSSKCSLFHNSNVFNSCIIHILYTICLFVCLFVCFWRDSPQWARAPSFTMFLDHTQRRTTVGRTPLDEWSAYRRPPLLPDNTTLATDSRTPCGTRTGNASKRATADPRLRPRSRRDGHVKQKHSAKHNFFFNVKLHVSVQISTVIRLTHKSLRGSWQLQHVWSQSFAMLYCTVKLWNCVWSMMAEQ